MINCVSYLKNQMKISPLFNLKRNFILYTHIPQLSPAQRQENVRAVASLKKCGMVTVFLVYFTAHIKTRLPHKSLKEDGFNPAQTDLISLMVWSSYYRISFNQTARFNEGFNEIDY